MPIVYEFHRLARRQNLEPGGDLQPVVLDEAIVTGGEHDSGLVVLDKAMNDLERIDPRKAQVVEMRFVGGLSVEQAAGVLKVSTITVKCDFRAARAWLYRELPGAQQS